MSFAQILQEKIKAPVKTAEPMSRHTTWQVGGPADYFVAPENEEELASIILTCNAQQMPYYVMGNGSNLLVLDGGIEGLVIKMGEAFSYVRQTPAGLLAGSGTLMTALAKEALKYSLTGLEFATGIPGSVGGAAIMNAGAFGSYIGERIEEVSFVTAKGELGTAGRERIEFGYRRSNLASFGIITAASFKLEAWVKTAIEEKMESYLKERQKKHPALPSCGSVFRNPPEKPAGRLIEEAGGKGYQVGEAAVSEQHANFIVNKSNAKAADILAVIEAIKALVEEKHGVKLEPEVKIIGRER